MSLTDTFPAPATSISHRLEQLHGLLRDAGTPFETEHDPDWPSSCERGQPFRSASGDWRTGWAPVSRLDSDGLPPADFAGLAAALEAPIHSDFCAFFSSFWSAGLELQAPDGPVSLLQLWNPQDVDRLIENLIGHVLVQRRARAPLTLFFACTDPESDLILSLDNDSGSVLLERPGQQPLRTVASNLSDFLGRLHAPLPSEMTGND